MSNCFLLLRQYISNSDSFIHNFIIFQKMLIKNNSFFYLGLNPRKQKLCASYRLFLGLIKRNNQDLCLM